MILSILWFIVSLVISIYFGITAYHNGFFVPSQPLYGQAKHFNFLSPMFFIVIIDFIMLIILFIIKNRLTDKSVKILSIISPIWAALTMFICLGTTLYN